MFLGQYTIAELKDLLKAKDFEVQKVQSAYDNFKGQWSSSDPDTASAWLNDWNALLARYNAAKQNANIEISLVTFSPVPDNVNPADAEYQAVLRSLQQTEGTVSPGDLQDLFSRVSAALAAANQKPISEVGLPQPAASSDFDENTLKAADATIKAAGLPPPRP